MALFSLASSVSYAGWTGSGVRDDNQPMEAAAGRCDIVIPADQLRDGLREVFRERGASRRRGKADLCIYRERGEMLVRLASAPPEIADLAHDASSKRDQIAGGEPILAASGICCSWSQGFRRDDERLGRRDEQSLRQAAPVTLIRHLDQVARLECAQVVVHLLAR